MENEIKVNDGNGLFDSMGLIDSLVVDCNEIPQALFEHQNIRFCNILIQMVQKLTELKKGVSADLQSKDKTISELTAHNKQLIEQITGLPAEKGEC